MSLRPSRLGLPVGVPHSSTPLLDEAALLELRRQDGPDQVRQEVTGPDVRPRVPVHRATDELTSVGTLLTDDLGPFHQRRVAEHQRTTLAAGDVLGLVEAHEGRERLGHVLERSGARRGAVERDEDVFRGRAVTVVVSTTRWR